MSTPRPSIPTSMPLNAGTTAALPLGSRSHSRWATALVGLGESGPALIEVTGSGAVRWWASNDGGTRDPLDLVWARTAPNDVVVAGLLLGPLAARSPLGETEGTTDTAPLTAAVVAARSGGYTVTIGGWPDDITHAADRGSVIDALLLYLGLSTAAEERSPALLVCSMWLDRLLAAAAGAPGAVTEWAAASTYHPLAAGPTAAPALVGEARSLSGAGWEPMRQAVARRTAALSGLTPRSARWMDEGAFARWLLDRYPNLDDSLEALAAVVPQRLASTVTDIIEATLA